MKIRFTIGVLFLLLQLMLVVYARFIPERFFCWAPYDEHSYYEISIEIDNQVLSKNEIQNRYGVYAQGWEPRSIHNILSIINQYESSYGKNDQAIVEVIYSINGHKKKLWIR